jgi:hypothetical protein
MRCILFIGDNLGGDFCDRRFQFWERDFWVGAHIRRYIVHEGDKRSTVAGFYGLLLSSSLAGWLLVRT